jgi:hypothetical protein
MTAKRKASARIQQGRIVLGPYLRSQSQQIKEAAGAFDIVFSSLQDTWTREIALDEKQLQAKKEGELRALVPEASKLGAKADEAWRALSTATGMLSDALIDDTRAWSMESFGTCVLQRP